MKPSPLSFRTQNGTKIYVILAYSPNNLQGYALNILTKRIQPKTTYPICKLCNTPKYSEALKSHECGLANVESFIEYCLKYELPKQKS